MPTWLLPEWWAPHAVELFADIAEGRYDLWLLARWSTQSLAATLIILFSDLLFGAAILRRTRIRLPARLRGATALALGTGVSALLIFLLGSMRRLSFPWVLAVTVLCGLTGVRLLFSRRGRRFVFGWIPALRPHPAWLLLIVPAVLIFGLDLMMPVIDYDSTMYHMASVRWYQDTHQLGYNGGIRFNAHPHLPMLLYLRHSILLGEDSLVKMLNIEFLLMLILALAHLARRYRVPAAWGLLFLMSSPILLWIARTEHSELAMTCWFAVAAVLLVERKAEAGLAGIVLGFAASSKLQGLVMAAAMCVAFFAARRALRPVLVLGAGVVLCGLPWWIRSWIHTGSPAYPFFLANNFDAQYLFRVSEVYGVGRDWKALLMLPWSMIALPAERFADPYIFGPALLILLAAGVAVLVQRRPLLSPQIWFLTITCALFFAFWFFTSQVMRYLASILPLIAMMFVAAIAALRPSRRWLVPLSAVAVIASLPPIASVRFAGLPPVTIGQKERMLANNLSYYYALRELNRVSHPDERTYLWFCEDARYYARSISYGDWFGEYRYSWAGEPGIGPVEMLLRMRNAGFRYLLMDRERSRAGMTYYSQEFRASGFARRFGAVPDGLKQLYDDGRYVLWRIE